MGEYAKKKALSTEFVVLNVSETRTQCMHVWESGRGRDRESIRRLLVG